MIEDKILHDRLVNDYDYDEKGVQYAIDKIKALTPEIYTAFEVWFNTGTVQEIEVEGYTVASLRKKNPRMNIIAAYLNLDFLKREPEKAKIAINKLHIPLRPQL